MAQAPRSARARQVRGRAKLAAADAVHANEVGVAEPADGAAAVLRSGPRFWDRRLDWKVVGSVVLDGANDEQAEAKD